MHSFCYNWLNKSGIPHCLKHQNQGLFRAFSQAQFPQIQGSNTDQGSKLSETRECLSGLQQQVQLYTCKCRLLNDQVIAIPNATRLIEVGQSDKCWKLRPRLSTNVYEWKSWEMTGDTCSQRWAAYLVSSIYKFTNCVFMSIVENSQGPRGTLVNDRGNKTIKKPRVWQCCLYVLFFFFVHFTSLSLVTFW